MFCNFTRVKIRILYSCHRLFRGKIYFLYSTSNIFCLLILFVLIHHILISLWWSKNQKQEPELKTSVGFSTGLLPKDPFDLYWTMWNTDDLSFRGRRFLVIDSIFIHHPQATVIMLSPSLNDANLFSRYRYRGYRIYSINVTIEKMVSWNWYLGEHSKDFLLHWNTSGTYFYSHLSDYMRAIVLYLYGGTYLDMDAIILRPLPKQEFIGFDRSGAGNGCAWCAKNTSGLYLAPGFMRFRSNRTVLRDILEKTFDRKIYNESCFNCVGPKAFTEHIFHHQNEKDPGLINMILLEPHRLYPFMWKETQLIFEENQKDMTLLVDGLMKRSYSLHFFGHMSDSRKIVNGSIMDILMSRLDLGDTRAKIANRDPDTIPVRLIHRSYYIFTPLKQGRFIGHDAVYFRINKTMEINHTKWTLNVVVSNGTMTIRKRRSLIDLNQAEVNLVLHEINYEPFETTFTDTLEIEVISDDLVIRSSLTILVFSKWVTFLSKTIGSPDRWHVVQRLIASIEFYFQGSQIHIASDWGQAIDRNAFLNFTSLDGFHRNTSFDTVTVHDLPEDSGLSFCRNYLVNITTTPFFFLMDDDFTIEEDSHLDFLLELLFSHSHIDIVAGKIPEDILAFNDFSGIFLYYNATLELRPPPPPNSRYPRLFPRSFHRQSRDRDTRNPCIQVDFVPNVFMGRKASFSVSSWDNEFKLGEHEDFFMRFGHQNRTVYTCRFINVHHHQEPWWKKVNSSYFPRRARVHTYFRKMLIKHQMKRLITFNYTNVDLDKNTTSI